MKSKTKQVKVRGYAVISDVIDRYWETPNRSYFAIFPFKKMADDFQKEYGPQEIIPIVISYQIKLK